MTDLKTRKDVHYARKLWHFFGVITIAVCYHNMSRPMALQTLVLVAAASIFVDVLRQRSEAFNRIVIRILGVFMRENERTGIAGTTYLLIGVLIIVAVFPPSVVTLSLLFLAIADPVASYYGVRYGRDKLIGRKSLQGSMAAFFVCMIVSAIYFFAHNMMTERILIVSILAGLIGAIAEIIPVGDLDDNLVMPVVSSGLLWIVYFFFGGF
jgi:diacylglycerol kinase (CTP)